MTLNKSKAVTVISYTDSNSKLAYFYYALFNTQNMLRMVTYVAVVLAVVVSSSFAQMIIPRDQLGYVYNGGSENAKIYLDIHMGPLCPDSRDALPAAKMVAQKYGPATLKLTLHMFPLPYHHQAYLTAIVSNTDIVFSFIGLVTGYRWLFAYSFCFVS